jgi:flagellar biosynthesis/type III secretory pathway protein FliH
MKPQDELELLYRHVCSVEVELQETADQHRKMAESAAYWSLFSSDINERSRREHEAILNKGIQDGYQQAQRRISEQIRLYKYERNRADAEAESRIRAKRK